METDKGTPAASAGSCAAAGSAVFRCGDEVTWTHCRSNGRSIQFTRREGRIVEVGKVIALCKRHRATAEWVRIDRLRHAGDRSELTDLVMGMGTPLSPGVQPNSGFSG